MSFNQRVQQAATEYESQFKNTAFASHLRFAFYRGASWGYQAGSTFELRLENSRLKEENKRLKELNLRLATKLNGA